MNIMFYLSQQSNVFLFYFYWKRNLFDDLKFRNEKVLRIFKYSLSSVITYGKNNCKYYTSFPSMFNRNLKERFYTHHFIKDLRIKY